MPLPRCSFRKFHVGHQHLVLLQPTELPVLAAIVVGLIAFAVTCHELVLEMHSAWSMTPRPLQAIKLQNMDKNN